MKLFPLFSGQPNLSRIRLTYASFEYPYNVSVFSHESVVFRRTGQGNFHPDIEIECNVVTNKARG